MSGAKVAHVTTIDLTLRNLIMRQMTRLLDEGFEVVGISAPGPWVSDLEDRGIRHVPWPHATRSWNPSADVRAFRELLRIFRTERFDIVHTHNPKPGIVGRIAGRIARVPCVVNTVHGLYATPEDPARKRIPVLGVEWLAARCSDLELFQSEEDLEWARRIKLVSEAKSAYLGNGTDLAVFSPERITPERVEKVRNDLGVPDGHVVVGTVGRLVAEKGYREFFEAASGVRRSIPGVSFVVVGDQDPDKADAILEPEIAAASDDVIFAGWREDIPEVLAAMDVFVLASWREGLPRSAVEAAAMGKPMVLTDIRGCREVVRDGVEGFLVPVRNPGRLAARIATMAGDEGLRDRMGAAALDRARDRFDEQKVTDIIVDAYMHLMRGKGLGTKIADGREAAGR